MEDDDLLPTLTLAPIKLRQHEADNFKVMRTREILKKLREICISNELRLDINEVLTEGATGVKCN